MPRQTPTGGQTELSLNLLDQVSAGKGGHSANTAGIIYLVFQFKMVGIKT